jgi:hypothetical protein
MSLAGEATADVRGNSGSDQVAVWGQANVAGGWYRIDLGGLGSRRGI